MTRADAITALILSPFVATCLVAIVAAVVYVAQRERSARVRRNPFEAPADVQAWRDANWPKGERP